MHHLEFRSSHDLVVVFIIHYSLAWVDKKLRQRTIHSRLAGCAWHHCETTHIIAAGIIKATTADATVNISDIYAVVTLMYEF